MSNNSKNCAVILAGGQGKRMKSDLPKPMFEVLGLPMLDWTIRACEDAGITDICVVTGFNHEVIEKHLDGKYHTVFQPQRMGTGHAVMMTIDWLKERADGNVLILNGDAPFIDKDTILGALSLHEEKNTACGRRAYPAGCTRHRSRVRRHTGLSGTRRQYPACP